MNEWREGTRDDIRVLDSMRLEFYYREGEREMVVVEGGFSSVSKVSSLATDPPPLQKVERQLVKFRGKVLHAIMGEVQHGRKSKLV